MAASGGEKARISDDVKDVEHSISSNERHPEEPLNWSWRKKHLALLVLIFETFLLKYTATFIAPGVHTLAEDFHTTAVKGTYLASATAIVPAFAPLIWIPLSQRLRRRPILLIGTIASMLFNIGLARSQTYAQALICRLFGYATASAGLCITPAAISDMFFFHEKGKRIGVNSFLLVVAPYLGGVTVGSIQYNPDLGWRWAMYIAAIMYACLFVAIFLCVPETIYTPKPVGFAPDLEHKKPLHERLGFKNHHPTGSWAATFKRPYIMFAYPSVLLPSIWFGVCYMSEVCNTTGFPLNFGKGSQYNFNTRQVGFCSFSGFTGASMAEWTAGPVCDFVAKKHLKSGQNWLGTLAGISIYAFGQEVLVTVLMTYMVDCYPQQAAEVAIVFQFCMNVMAYHPPFYTPMWIASASAKVPYIVYAVLSVVLFPPCLGLFMLKGTEIRKKGPWGKMRVEDTNKAGEEDTH
ncbi:major facilitator superfamily domain-containing protein [Lophiotrema nucula]|uniref:Major facilitator superfamily domain-containing protein n=1 Tax=Lophiotrema nucula TaxID=690887 RepID=A0A6A5YZ11_9PLEO|nr:major facilitator superfamily domain-containing protein [Lophiotrema nucula]